MRDIGRVAAIAVFLLGVLWLAGCAANGGRAGNSVVVTPPSSLLQPGEQQTFVCNVPVAWSISELDGGYITPSGTYTAPGMTGTFHIIATSLSDPARKATATITVASSGIVSVLTALPMADAVSQGYPDGGNLVQWPFMSDRVIAYFIYRDTNPFSPIAVAPGSILYYVDSATPLPQIGAVMESRIVDIEIDSLTGVVRRFDTNPTYESSLANLHNAEMDLADQTLHIACRRVPIQPGEMCGYMVQVLYEEYRVGGLDDPPGYPGEYRLYLGNRSGATERVTLTEPPELVSPGQGQYPRDGIYTCTRSTDAMSYRLQISSSPIFSTTFTYTESAVPTGLNAVAYLDPDTLFALFRNYTGRPLYWRMGARIDGGPRPGPLSDPNQQGWVFSEYNYFILPDIPPSPP
jgi:hypothetical protein